MAGKNPPVKATIRPKTGPGVDFASCGDEPMMDPANLTDRLNGLCATLAGCEELLEAIHARLDGRPPSAGGEIPHDNTITGAVAVATMRADTILSNLRELASSVGA